MKKSEPTNESMRREMVNKKTEETVEVTEVATEAPTPEAPKVEAAPTFTMEMLMAILDANNKANREMLTEVITEVKKPTVLEQKKLDEEAAQLKRRAEDRKRIGEAEEMRKQMSRSGCQHGTYHPGTGAFKHTWVGQVHADGMIRPMCTQCTTVMPPVKATPEQMQSGVNLNAYKGLNAEMLLQWHKATVKNCSDANCEAHKVAVGA